MFPLWLLQFLVFGGLALCATGVITLLVLLVVDSRGKRIW